MAFGDHNDMQKAIDLLAEVKESIINAYEEKTGLSRAKIARLMEDETWMNARKALDLGFIDRILGGTENAAAATAFSAHTAEDALRRKLAAKYSGEKPQTEPTGRRVSDLMERLNLMKH
jgi:ATP-dependent Clp protease protease subunit